MKMDIIVSTPCRAWLTDLPDAVATGKKVVRLTLAQADLECNIVEVGVTLTDNVEMRTLNRNHRQQDKPTNVLSFAVQNPDVPHHAGPLLLGDIVLAHGLVLEEAQQQGKCLHDHYCHLLVHGTLHLLGHDHVEEEEAAEMEAKEVSILDGIGIADPYENSANLSITNKLRPLDLT